ncbi:uncharacterized protein LOC117640804 isoform X2 [Thrips palmi]|uniref:Uncharacterized protein LOC117640804 isoform X2 n=1 Tax=Thrips palmi TaxID=161013 RepID=A0A6P8ZIG8_THRPL|nr:uncharacterized protein LOC117640804 isoform X2 [Thrips palmi]
MTANMDNNSGLNKLRAASCSVLLLLLTLALVASSLLVARYAVAASSWWLSLLAITVCLLGLCTWIQLAASRAGRAGRWRIMLARQMALSRAQRTVGGALAPDLYGIGATSGRNAASGSGSRGAGARGHPHVAIIPLESELDSQVDSMDTALSATAKAPLAKNNNKNRTCLRVERCNRASSPARYA